MFWLSWLVQTICFVRLLFSYPKNFFNFFQKSVGNHASLDSVMRKEGDTNFCTILGGVMMKPMSLS